MRFSVLPRCAPLCAVVLALGISADRAAAQAGGVDGAYTGAFTLTGDFTHVGNFHCTPGTTTVRVAGGQFTWKIPAYAGSAQETKVPVGGDGSFSLSQGEYQLSGKIAGDHFVADSHSHYCAFHFDLLKKS